MEPEVYALEARDEGGSAVSVCVHGRRLVGGDDFALYAAGDGSMLVYDARDHRVYRFGEDLFDPFVVADVEVLRFDAGCPAVEVGAAR